MITVHRVFSVENNVISTIFHVLWCFSLKSGPSVCVQRFLLQLSIDSHTKEKAWKLLRAEHSSSLIWPSETLANRGTILHTIGQVLQSYLCYPSKHGDLSFPWPFTGFVFFWQQHPQPMVLSTPTMNLMLALCVIVSLISVFFFSFFFLSHPICENFSPGALLYQAPAAAVILDMAGSRYRKTARAHSTQKNLEIPLIYPRLWLQSKLVEKRKWKERGGDVGGGKGPSRQLRLGCVC